MTSTTIPNLLTKLNIILATGFLALSLPLLAINSNASAASSDMRDCDTNAVIRCGVGSVDELQRKFNNNSDIRFIFRQFSITTTEVGSMDTTVQSGTVTKSGDVKVDGKVVATGAMTAGRIRLSSGDQQVGSGKNTFFIRSTSTSFNQNSLNAFVAMKDGRFQFAVLTSCGNPVRANAVTKTVAKTQPKQAQPAPTTVVQQQQTQVNQQVVNNQINTPPAPTTTVAAAPAPAPQPAPQPAPAPTGKGEQPLPDTGPGSVVGIASATTIAAGVGHLFYTKMRRRLF